VLILIFVSTKQKPNLAIISRIFLPRKFVGETHFFGRPGRELIAAAALAADLAAITEAEILSYTVALRTVYNDTVTTGGNRDEGATLVIRKEDNFKGILKVPAPINAIFDSIGNVDITNAAVTAFVSNFLTGADFVFSDGEQGTALLSGRLDK